ncbi:MAG: hydrogenase maturation nickel metallochaperone HypA [Vicinamibacterales bacterium]
MHELGLAHEILSLVQQHVPAGQAALVRGVHVRVGELAGVVVASLDFCFDALVSGTPWQQAHLVVEHVPSRAVCADCATVFATAVPGAGCPACGSGAVRMVSGDELHVDAVDLDDGPEQTEPVDSGAQGASVNDRDAVPDGDRDEPAGAVLAVAGAVKEG